jgi:hypothetical protein
MCERAVWLALAALLAGGPVRGQDQGVLRTRIARLERELTSAEAAAARADSLARISAAPYDTVSVGALRIMATVGIGPDTRAGVAAAWSLIDSAFGTAAGVLAKRSFALVLPPDPGGLRRATGAATPVLTTGTAADVEQRLVWAAATAIASQNDSALTTWLQGALVPNRHPALERRGVYIGLVTAPSPAGRRCYQGGLAACRSSLGLVPAVSALEDWYDAVRRRSLVQELEGLEEVRADPGLFAACVRDLSDVACLAVLRRIPPAAFPPPLPAAARYSLLRTAVELGGRGAYARLVAGAGQAIETRLIAASGVSGDSLIRAWRAAIFDARPEPVAVGPRAGWVALAWGLAFALISLRSTRWR